MATLKTNTLTGTSTAGSIAVTAEGNSTTTNLQQGLAKAWVNFNGTGDYTTSFTNNMGNDDYATGFGCNTGEPEVSTLTTSSTRVLALNSSGSNNDKSIISYIILGDLA